LWYFASRKGSLVHECCHSQMNQELPSVVHSSESCRQHFSRLTNVKNCTTVDTCIPKTSVLVTASISVGSKLKNPKWQYKRDTVLARQQEHTKCCTYFSISWGISNVTSKDSTQARNCSTFTREVSTVLMLPVQAQCDVNCGKLFQIMLFKCCNSHNFLTMWQRNSTSGI
jgi:hypothetical protein